MSKGLEAALLKARSAQKRGDVAEAEGIESSVNKAISDRRDGRTADWPSIVA